MAGIEMRIGRAQTGQGLRRRAGPSGNGLRSPVDRDVTGPHSQ